MFYPRHKGSLLAFESVQYSGDFLIMNDNGTLTLGNPKGKIHEFTLATIGSDRNVYLNATLPSGANCYVAFDSQGSPLANRCWPLDANGQEDAKLRIDVL